MPTKPMSHIARLTKSKPWKRQRNSGDRMYGLAKWHRFRGMFLRRNPICCDPDNRHPGRTAAAVDVDHIIPLSARMLGHTWDNVQVLCKLCNCDKRNKMPETWCDAFPMWVSVVAGGW